MIDENYMFRIFLFNLKDISRGIWWFYWLVLNSTVSSHKIELIFIVHKTTVIVVSP